MSARPSPGKGPAAQAGSRLRVLVLTNLFPNPREPLRSTFNEQQILAMTQFVEIAEVVVPVDLRRKLSWLFGRRPDDAGSGTGHWRGIPVSYPAILHVPKIARWLNGPLMFLSLLPHARRLRRLGVDSIYATWAYPDGFAAVLLGAICRVPVCIKVHGSDVEVLASDRLRRLMTMWGLRKAARVVSVAQYLKDALVRYGLDVGRVSVVYNGIDRERFHPRDRITCRRELGLDERRPLVIYVGNLKVDKGILDLACAAQRLVGEGEAEVAFIGDGTARAQLCAAIRAAGIDGRVRILGRLAPGEIARWMCAANVLCLPSHHEGVPNVILEATACGTPCVATAVGGIPEVVNAANGMLVPAHDPRSIAEALVRALALEWDSETVSRGLETYGWAENASRVATILGQARESREIRMPLSGVP